MAECTMYGVCLEKVIEEKLAKAETYGELHQVLELTAGNLGHLEISRDVSKRLVEIACGFKERLEAFRIAFPECEKIAFQKVSELANGFENWFVIWRLAPRGSEEKIISFNEIKKSAPSPEEWQQFWRFTDDDSEEELIALQGMKTLKSSVAISRRGIGGIIKKIELFVRNWGTQTI